MKIHNFLDMKLNDEIIHEGNGLCKNAMVFNEKEIEAPVRFINYSIVPPGCSFGLHKHENDNEFYIVLNGEGVYYQDGEQVSVKKGDIMMNAPFGEHGIENIGEVDIELLVFEVVIAKEGK